jgi:hypothetical protein
MEASEYLELLNKSKVSAGRVVATHCWINKSAYLRIFNDKDEAIENAKGEDDTLHFRSESEALRYQHLRLEESEGLIINLDVQPKFTLIHLGNYQLTWKADFQYQMIVAEKAITIVEDVKSYQEKTGKWFVANGRTHLKMELFEAWRENFHKDWKFYLVDSHSGESEYFHEAQFVS